MKYELKHYYQPTNNSCSQSALAMLLSYYGKDLTPEQIMESIPVNKNEKGEDWGTINQHLATWCLSQGFNVTIHTADFEIIDLTWADLSKDKLLERMELAKDKRDVPALGKEWSKIYMQSYIDFVKAGGELVIHQYMTTKLLDELLAKGPILVCVNYSVLYNAGRGKTVGLRQSESDDIDGKLMNHSVVVQGKDAEGSYLIADPWKEPGHHTVEPERLLVSMTASQMECDNVIIQLTPKNT